MLSIFQTALRSTRIESLPHVLPSYLINSSKYKNLNSLFLLSPNPILMYNGGGLGSQSVMDFYLSELQNWVYYFSMMRNSRINGKSMLDHNLFHAIKTNISLSFMFTNLQILLELDQTFWSVVRFMMLRSASFLCHFQILSEFLYI